MIRITDDTGQAFHLRLEEIFGVCMPGPLTPGDGKARILFGRSMAVAATVTVSNAEAWRVIKAVDAGEEPPKE